jgi:hypothetical protein
VQEGPPTKSHLERSPLTSLERAGGRRRNEPIRGFTNLGEGLIHGLGDFVRSVPSQVFLQGVGENTAARALSTLGEALRTFKNIVRYGYGRFHTSSITSNEKAGKRMLAASRGRSAVIDVPSARVGYSTDQSDQPVETISSIPIPTNIKKKNSTWSQPA